jgi:GT2 family glycosyltransferase
MLSDFQPKVAIVILTYNNKSFIERFMPSVLATTYENKEIWVADNASSDGSTAYVFEHFPEVKILESEENLGYAGGYNWALEQIEADYYVLLNSDVRVSSDWLDSLVELAISDENIVAIQPKILDAKSPEKFEYAGACGGFLDKWGYAFCRGRIFESLEEDKGQYDDITEVFWATGACLFVKAKAFEQVGALDGDFFAHMEEIDLCWRLQRAGYKVFVNPNSVVYHVGGGTLNEGSHMKYYLNFKNNLILLAKNEASVFWFVKLLWRMILDGVSAVKFVVDGNAKLFTVVIKAHIEFWSTFGKTLAKRKAVKALGNTQAKLYPKSIVFSYFIRKKTRFSDL